MTAIHQKQQKKRGILLKAAYQCFLTKGFAKTTIDDIVRHAEVAKGTFYLYYRDKDELMDQLVIQISYELVMMAYQKTKEASISDFLDQLIFFIDTIIEYFKENKEVLNLIKRNFSWPLALKMLDDEKDEQIRSILEELLSSPVLAQYEKSEAMKIIVMIVELTGSVCYTSIIKEQPEPIDLLKPTLFDMIRKILA